MFGRGLVDFRVETTDVLVACGYRLWAERRRGVAAISVATTSPFGLPYGRDTLHSAFEGLEFGLDALCEPGL